MSEQYEYKEQDLTPNMAQELIQELFAGQTVPIQQIKTRVDEVHEERGGRLLKEKVNHPATYALSRLKSLGLADNSERGLWFISLGEQPQPEKQSESEKHLKIKTLDEFIKWAQRFGQGEYVFRGVPNHAYGIQASAYRRPKENRNFEKFFQINQDLIRDVRLRGYDQRNGREMQELEMLAELQHYGAATCLIDFTYNAQVALWFACEENSRKLQDCCNEIQCKKRQSEPPNGKVFAVRNKPPIFREITPTLLKKDIGFFLQDDVESQLYCWQPRQQNNRIIAQQSVFLFGRYEFDANEVCIIEEGSKENIMIALQQVSGITKDSLFCDFEGFANVRSEKAPYTELTATQYRERGFLAYERRDYKDAIADYNIAVEKNPDYAEAYYERGLAKVRLEQYEDAIADYNIAVEKNPNYVEAYYKRGAAKYNLELYEEAIIDYDEVIHLNPNYVEAYYRRGAAKSNLGLHEEAMVDANQAIHLDPNYANAYCMRGYEQYRLELHDEAITDYDDAIRLNPDFEEAYFWRGIAKIELGKDASAILDFDRTILLNSKSANAYAYRAQANYNLRNISEAMADIQVALPMAEESDDNRLIIFIRELLYEIESRTAGGSENE